ncbi:hypothetical protein TNCV_107331 [Trichonephila clavipes]|nr:hypothetical protein TNCV_107331 [Trichonephila clavipes]
MDVCICIVPSWHGGTLNSVELPVLSRGWWQGMRGGRLLALSQGVLPQNSGLTVLNHTVICMVLKASSNDRRVSSHDEFRGPRSDHVRQVSLATTTK